MEVKTDSGGHLSGKSYTNLFSTALENARLNVVTLGWML